MTFTMRQRQIWLAAKGMAPALAMGVMLGFAKPFSATPPLSAPVRYAFWVSMVFIGYGAVWAARKLIPQTSVSNPSLRLFLAALGSAAPITFVSAWVIPFIRPGHPAFDLAQLLTLFLIVATVQVAIACVLFRKPEADRFPQSPPVKEGSELFPRALVSRLPERLGREIIALEAEDHYLRVHTTLGSDLVLMRLSDAIAAIGPNVGLQVHRSWWVAQAAICEAVRSEQRSQLKLKNGLLVPIGRTYSAAVRSRAAGALATG